MAMYNQMFVRTIDQRFDKTGFLQLGGFMLVCKENLNEILVNLRLAVSALRKGVKV